MSRALMLKVGEIDERRENVFDSVEEGIAAIKSGTKYCNDFTVAAHLTEIMLLTNIAVLTARYNTALEYDGENMRFTNLPEANDLFHYEYRKDWTL